MSMTDPISDFLTRIRNAIKAEKKSVDIPASNLKIGITEILKNANFINDYSVIETENKRRFISIKLKYNGGISVIEGLKRISRPGIRRYTDAENLPRVRNGLGIAIISTSKGLLTDKQARSQKIGGEVMCEIW
ncbi:MAG: 30S ribosomal protein S8 [Ignavibacteria bacterium]|jgi:small subunit ribosomal protein S8|nr:30S ribosomal protein S8 [Ignavibacteria bacterium]